MSANLIVAEAAKHFGFTYNRVISKSRHGPLMLPRIAATFAMRRRGFSLPRISKLLNRRCHSVAINNLEKTHLLENPGFAELVDRLATIDLAPEPVKRRPGRPRKEPVVWIVKGVRPIELTPRQMVARGQIDHAQLAEFEANADMKRGSKLLADAISSQFQYAARAA